MFGAKGWWAALPLAVQGPVTPVARPVVHLMVRPVARLMARPVVRLMARPVVRLMAHLKLRLTHHRILHRVARAWRFT